MNLSDADSVDYIPIKPCRATSAYIKWQKRKAESNEQQTYNWKFEGIIRTFV